MTCEPPSLPQLAEISLLSLPKSHITPDSPQMPFVCISPIFFIFGKFNFAFLCFLFFPGFFVCFVLSPFFEGTFDAASPPCPLCGIFSNSTASPAVPPPQWARPFELPLDAVTHGADVVLSSQVLPWGAALGDLPGWPVLWWASRLACLLARGLAGVDKFYDISLK